jgi:hypothetical protein
MAFSAFLVYLGLLAPAPSDSALALVPTQRPYFEAYLKTTSALSRGAQKARSVCHRVYRETVKGVARFIGGIVMIGSVPRFIIRPSSHSIRSSAYYEGESTNDAVLGWMVDRAPGLYHTDYDCREFGIEPWRIERLPSRCMQTVSRFARITRCVLAIIPATVYLGVLRAARASTTFMLPAADRAAKRSYQAIAWTVGPKLPDPPTVPIPNFQAYASYNLSWDGDRESARVLYMRLCGCP